MFRKTVLLLCCCLSLAACAKKASVPAVSSPADFVAVTLGDAAEQAHGELAMLAKLRGQGLQPLLPPPDPSLNKPVSVAWTGPAAGALKEICLELGYRYEEMGSPSAQSLNRSHRRQTPLVVPHGLMSVHRFSTTARST